MNSSANTYCQAAPAACSFPTAVLVEELERRGVVSISSFCLHPSHLLDEESHPSFLFDLGLGEPMAFERLLAAARASGVMDEERERSLAARQKTGRQRAEDWMAREREMALLSVPLVYRTEFRLERCALPLEVWRAIEAWSPLGGMGLALAGASGLGKTRALTARLLSLPERVTWHWVSAVELAKAAREQFDKDEGRRQKADGLLRRAQAVRVLLLDDLGKENVTPAAGEALWKWWRAERAGLPILWSSNLGGEALAAHYGARGVGLVRRLRDFSVNPA